MTRGRPRVKLCGITRDRDREAAVAAGADALGFIVDVPVDSPRELAAERAADLVSGVPPFVTSVLVTMPDTVEAAVDLADDVGADALQVHATLGPGQVETLRAHHDGAVVTAVDTDDDVAAHAAAADAVLVDSVDEHGAGGTGETHDWARTREHVEAVDAPVVLAGGLTPENVGDAIEVVDPFAVDTASGVEREGGVKDHNAMAAFVERSRQAATGSGNESPDPEVGR